MTTTTMILLCVAMSLTLHLASVDGVLFTKLTYPLSLNLMALQTSSARSTVQCSLLCGRTPKCQFFSWNSADASCVAYRSTVLAGVSPIPTELYLNQGLTPCPLNRIKDIQGKCVCANGRYGHSCENAFQHVMTLQQLFPANNSYDAEHIEINGVSYLIQLSKENGTTPNLSGFFSIHARDAQVSTTYNPVMAALTNSYGRGVSAFNHKGVDYFMHTGLYSFPYNSTYAFQVLYNYDPVSKQFVERSRFNQIGACRSSFFHNVNGDLYMCLAISSGAQSPFIYKFNATDATFNKTFSMPMTGTHYTCRFFSINSQVYVISQGSQATSFNKIYHLNPDDTWSWHQDIPLTNYSIIWSYDVLNTDDLVLLVASFANAHKVIVYQWDGAYFNTSQTIALAGTWYPVYIRLMQVASDVFLLIDSSSSATSFSMYKYNTTSALFSNYTSVAVNGPFGKFKEFWYNDALHLLVVNDYNGSVPSTDPMRYYANNYLFRWE